MDLTPRQKIRIAARARRARQLHIWERAWNVALKLGEQTHYKQGGDYTDVLWELKVMVGSRELHVICGNKDGAGRWKPDRVEIRFGGKTVFFAEEVHEDANDLEMLRSLQARWSGKMRLLQAYRPGSWEMLLSLRPLRKAQRKASERADRRNLKDFSRAMKEGVPSGMRQFRGDYLEGLGIQ
jgi:hypothetical protein